MAYRLLHVAVVFFLSSISFVFATEVHLDYDVPSSQRPEVSVSRDGRLLIKAALPNSNGVSLNKFDYLKLDGMLPLIEVDENTQAVSFLTKGEKLTTLENLHGIGVTKNGKPFFEVKIGFKDPSGIYCFNSTAVADLVVFDTPEFGVHSLGFNSTGSVLVRAGKTVLTGPMLAKDIEFNGNEFDCQSDVLASKMLRLKLKGNFKSVGILQGEEVRLKASSVNVGNDGERRAGIFALSDADPTKKPYLEIDTNEFVNSAHVVSEGILEAKSKKAIQNSGFISGLTGVKLVTNELLNFKDIIAYGKFWVTGTEDGQRAKKVTNPSGRILAYGPALIEAKTLYNFPQGFENFPYFGRSRSPDNIATPEFLVNPLINSYVQETDVESETHHGDKAHAISLKEVKRTQEFKAKPVPATMSFYGGLSYDGSKFENTMSNLVVRGNLKVSGKPVFKQQSAGLLSRRDLFVKDVKDVSFAGGFANNPGGIVFCSINPFCWFGASASAINGAWYESPDFDLLNNEVKPEIVAYKKGDEDYKCRVKEFFGHDRNIKEKGFRCKDDSQFFYSSLNVAGEFVSHFTEVKNLHWQKSEGGYWVNTTSEVEFNEADIVESDQVIFPSFDEIKRNRHLYEVYRGDLLANATKQKPQIDYWYKEKFPSLLNFRQGGIGDLVPMFRGFKRSEFKIAMSPALELESMQQALFTRLGPYAPSLETLIENTRNYLQVSTVKLGFGLTPEQIAGLDRSIMLPVFVKNPEGAEYDDLLVPVVYMDKPTLIDIHSLDKTVIAAEIIDLTADTDIVNFGKIESFVGKLKLYAKKVANFGDIVSAEDIELYASEGLLVETLVDSVTGNKKGKANLLAKQNVQITGKKSLSSIGAEVKGEVIEVRSDGVVVLLPKETVEVFKEMIRKGFDEERRKKVCTNFVENDWEAGKSIKIEALTDVKIGGGSFKAKEILKIQAKTGDVVTEQFQKICSEEIYEKEGGLAGWFNKRVSEAVKTSSETMRAVFESGKMLVSAGKKEGKVAFGAADIKAKELEVDTGGNVLFAAGKRVVKSCKDNQKNYLFSFDDNGRFYVFGGDRNWGCDESLKYDRSVVDVDKVRINAGGFVNFAGVNVSSGKWEVSGKKGVNFLSLTESHISSWRRVAGGFFFDFIFQPEEISLGAGVGGAYGQSESSAHKGVVNDFSGLQGLKVTSKMGTVEFEGGRFFGDLEIDAQKISMQPCRGQICLNNLDISAELSARVGIKSKLVKAIANALHMAESDVEVWEDGVNLGFKIFSSGVEIATAMLMPVEGGVWATGKASAQYASQCFDFLMLPSIVGENIKLTAAQCVSLVGAQILGVNGHIKAKCLKVKAAVKNTTFTQAGGLAEGEIPIYGAVVPGFTVEASYNSNTSTIFENSHLFFENKLRLEIEDEVELEGAVVQAKQLFADFGSLLIKSVQDEMQLTGYKGSISINPKELAELSKVLVGGGLGASRYSTKFVKEVTSLSGGETAQIVVRGLLKSVGAIVANAERDVDGKLTDKGLLQLKMGSYLQEDLENFEVGGTLGGGFNRGYHKGLHGTVNAEFGFANQYGLNRATVGLGNVTETPEGDFCGTEFDAANRNVSEAEEAFHGPKMKPVRASLPVPNLSAGGKHFKEYLRGIGKCATGFDCFRYSARSIINGRDQLLQSQAKRKLSPKERRWQELFKSPIEFPEEITEEEGQQIVNKVNKDYQEAEERFNEKGEEGEFARELLQQAKSLDAQSMALEVLRAKARNEEDFEVSTRTKHVYKKVSSYTREWAEEFIGGDERKIQAKIDEVFESNSQALGGESAEEWHSLNQQEQAQLLQRVLFVAEMVPLIGEGINLFEAIRGVKLGTGEQLTLEERAGLVALAAVGIIPVGKVLKIGNSAVKIAKASTKAVKAEKHAAWVARQAAKNGHGYFKAPKTLRKEFFGEVKSVSPKTFVKNGGKKRERWVRKDNGNIYEWDSMHGTVELYDKRGRHLGEYDPISGGRLKYAEKTRRVEP